MVVIPSVDIFDAEIINHKVELDESGHILPKAGSVGDFIVSHWL